MNATKENDYICGNCKYWDSDLGYCELTGDFDLVELDTCDDWTDPDEVELTEDEKQGIIGDIRAHRIMVEGREIG